MRLKTILGTFGLLALACNGGPVGPAAGTVDIEDPGEVFVGEWLELQVQVGAGIDFDNLSFTVDAGDSAGLVSMSRDDTFDPSSPTIMLLAGWEPGADYTITAWDGGAQVGQTSFDLSGTWNQGVQTDGPSHWFSGTTGAPPVGAAWGSDTAGVQNVNTLPPATNSWDVAVILVDFDDVQIANPATVASDWVDRFENDADSVRAYYDEVSNGSFTVNATSAGPFALDGDWTDFFPLNDDGDGYDRDPGFFQACITAADSNGVNLANVETVFCLSASPDPTASPRQMAWPTASIGMWGPYTVSSGDKNFGVISFGDSWDLAFNWRPHARVAAHELGHNLGLGDQYTPVVLDADGVERNVASWGLMHEEWNYPHLTLGHRLMLGWVDPDEVYAINIGTDLADPANDLSTKVLLNPVEQHVGADNAHYVGVEFRISDGWNYYYEYRHGQPGQVGDQGGPIPQGATGAVLATDVMADRTGAPIARPVTLLMPQDSVFTSTADSYVQKDIGTGNALRVDLDSFPGNDDVELWVRYGDSDDAVSWDGTSPSTDPSIRPWPAADNRQWQSPDIEIKNDKNDGDPDLFNIPWADNPNTIVASTKNSGTLDAIDVDVTFYVSNQNIAEMPLTLLGTVTEDIPAGDTVDFEFQGWIAPSGGHYCVVAIIEPYDSELSRDNNWAQSNYHRFSSGSASPAHRVRTTVAISNPYDRPTRFEIHAAQSEPSFRTYLETTSVWLQPGEEREILVMFEYAEQKPTRLENHVRISGWISDPSRADWTDDSPGEDILVPTGGAEFIIVSGYSTEIVNVESRKDGVVGRVQALDGTGVSSGHVILGYKDAGGDYQSKRGELDAQGNFLIDVVPEDIGWGRVDYVSDSGDFVESSVEL